MPYAKKTWALDDPITDVALNNIETGVAAAHNVLDAVAIPSTQAMGDTALVGTSAALARADHKHAMPTFGHNANQVMAGNHIRCGAFSNNVISQGTEYTVPFLHTFPLPPVVVTTLRNGANVNVIVRILSTTTTRFTYSVSDAAGSSGGVVADFNWIAMVNP